MKTRIMKFYKNHEDEISVGCLLVTVTGLGWIVGYKMATYDSTVTGIQSDVDKIEEMMYVLVHQKNGKTKEFSRELDRVLENK